MLDLRGVSRGSLLVALGLVACGRPHSNNDTGGRPESGGGAGAGLGAEGGDAGASAGKTSGGAGDGAGDAGELGGAGAANQAADEAEATAPLEATVKAALGSSAFVTDVSEIAGHAFELRDCIGPYEPPCDTCDGGSAWIDAANDYSYGEGAAPFCPKLTLHFIETDDGLALIVEMPTQTFPYAEQLKLERRGDTWLAKGIATSTRLALRNEDPEWATDYYKAALAVFAFADDDRDGEPDRVVTAATNSVEGSLLVDGRPVHTDYDEYRRIGWVKWGKAEGVALSQGSWVSYYDRPSAIELTTHGVDFSNGMEALDTPGFPPDPSRFRTRFDEFVLLGGKHHVFALTAAVSADSVFHFENAQGEQSTLTPISIRPIEGYEANGRYIHGFVAADGLSGDWELIGEGTMLNGKPFHLDQPITLHDSNEGGAGGASSQ